MNAAVVSQEVLKSFTPFDTLNEEYLGRVASKVKILEFPKGSLIFKRGRALNESFYLVEGNVDLVDSKFSVTSINRNSEHCRFPLSGSSPTKVSAVAKSGVKLLTVERDFLDLVMAWSESGDPSTQTVTAGACEADEDRDWMSCLLQSPLFTQIPPAHIQQLFARFETVTANAGDEIVREGEPGDYFYVIEIGTARVQGRGGKVDVSLKAGHYFGEEALVGDTTRNATVTMTCDGSLMRLGKEDFKTLLQEPVIRYITVEELRDLQINTVSCQLLDVRLPLEYRHQHVPDSINVPLSALRNRCAAFDKQTRYIVTDNGGRRSEVAVHLLCQAGYDALILRDAGQHGQQP